MYRPLANAAYTYNLLNFFSLSWIIHAPSRLAPSFLYKRNLIKYTNANTCSHTVPYLFHSKIKRVSLLIGRQKIITENIFVKLKKKCSMSLRENDKSMIIVNSKPYNSVFTLYTPTYFWPIHTFHNTVILFLEY